MMMKITLKGITWLITSLFILPTLSLAGPYDVIIVGRESGSEKGFISADETHSKSERDDKGLTQKVGVGCYREHPSLDAKIKFKLEEGSPVSVKDKKGGWYLVGLKDGRQGWAHQSLFFSTDQKGREIKEIGFEITPLGDEMVTVLLNDFSIPQTFAVKGDRPKFVCEFFKMGLGGDIHRSMKVDGRMIERISVELHEGNESRVRIVLDLVPQHDYDLLQLYYKEADLHTMTVKKRNALKD
ncbi:MAG: SH3 domain-containing protein [Pseudomonadota bacterium]